MPRLVNIDDVISYLDWNEGESKKALLTIMVEGIEDLAERHARRRFAPADESDATETKLFTVKSGQQYVRVPDLRTVTAITLDGTVMDATNYDLGYGEPPYTRLMLAFGGTAPANQFGKVSTIGSVNPKNLSISGKWGFATCPLGVRHAVCLLSSRAWKRRQTGFVDTLALGDGTVGGYLKDLDPEACRILDSYRVPAASFVG